MSIPIALRPDFDAAAVRRVAKATRDAAQGRRLLDLPSRNSPGRFKALREVRPKLILSLIKRAEWQKQLLDASAELDIGNPEAVL